MCVSCLDYAIVISDDECDDVEDDNVGDTDNLQEIAGLLCAILQSLAQIYNILQNLQQIDACENTFCAEMTVLIRIYIFLAKTFHFLINKDDFI